MTSGSIVRTRGLTAVEIDMCICIWNMARVGYLNAKTLSAEVPFNTHGAMTKPRGRRTQARVSLRLQITLWVIGTHLSPHQHTCAHLRMSEIPRRRWPCASSVALKAHFSPSGLAAAPSAGAV